MFIFNTHFQYKLLSTSLGNGFISVSNSYSIYTNISLSSSLMKFIANPKCPNLIYYNINTFQIFLYDVGMFLLFLENQS